MLGSQHQQAAIQPQQPLRLMQQGQQETGVPVVQAAQQQQQQQGASGRNPPAIVQPQPAQEVLQQQPQQHAPGGLQDSQQMPPPPPRAAPAQHQQVPRQAEALRDQQQQPQEPAQQQQPGREPPGLVDIDAELESLAAENSQLRQRLTTAARNTATPTQVRWAWWLPVRTLHGAHEGSDAHADGLG